MHEKSKFHIDAKLQGTDKVETVQKVVKTQIPDQPKTQKLDIKPVEPKQNVENQKTEDEEWGGFFGD